MKAIEKELDRLVQMLHLGQRCHICGYHNAEAVHHIIGRANQLLRYDVVNLLPVCNSCHRKIHDNGLDVSDYIDSIRWNYLQRVKNESYRDILTFELQMSEDEYLRWCKRTLKTLIQS